MAGTIQKNPRVIITGGTEGIGRGIAEEFLAQSASVAVCAKTKEKLDKIKTLYPKIITKRVDLRDQHATEEFAVEALNALQGIDALILNAAMLDLHFKHRFDMNKEDIRKALLQMNTISNIALIQASKEALKKSLGAIIFITTRFIFKNIESAPTIEERSAAAQEDIGGYIESKKEMHSYLNRFIEDKENEGIFVLSVIPGTVDTTMNRKIIESGTPEMRDAKIKERAEGKERDPGIVGKIIATMAITRKKFNPETLQYDIAIKNGEVVEVSNAAAEFEKKRHLDKYLSV